jgi:hypothetical protein
MKPVPQTPDQLKRALGAIFPGLPRDFGASGESVLEDAGPTWHSLLRDFELFFARNLDQLPDRQLRRFAELVARCVDEGGALGEAMQECVVTPAREQPELARFAPFLAAS